MFVPDRYYIYQPEQWVAQQFKPLEHLAERVVERGESALDAHHAGKVVAYRAHGKFIRLLPVPAWREVHD